MDEVKEIGVWIHRQEKHPAGKLHQRTACLSWRGRREGETKDWGIQNGIKCQKHPPAAARSSPGQAEGSQRTCAISSSSIPLTLDATQSESHHRASSWCSKSWARGTSPAARQSPTLSLLQPHLTKTQTVSLQKSSWKRYHEPKEQGDRAGQTAAIWPSRAAASSGLLQQHTALCPT